MSGTGRVERRRRGGASGLGPIAALLLACAPAPAALAQPVAYTLVTHPSFARHAAGADRLIGTADDVVLPPQPGADGAPGTSDDLIVNPSGSVVYLRLAALPLGGDYEVFWPGTLTVQTWSAAAGAMQAADFALAGPATLTNGLTGAVSDGKAPPHFLLLTNSGTASGAFPLSTCLAGAGGCTQVVLAFTGAALAHQPGRDDPFLVPGITAAQAAYLGLLKSLVPSNWTQLWLLEAPPTVLGAADVSGDAAAFLLGGQASAMLAFYTTDPAALGQDDDGDGVPNASDNCPWAANAAQTDRGGVGAGSPPDGIGDACQCGDVSGDGRVTLSDAILVSRSLLKPPLATLLRPELCDVAGVVAPPQPRCTLADGVVLRRALLTPPTATVAQQCAPATP